MIEKTKKLSVVLGATGAIGSAVVRKLVEKNQPVRAVARNIDYAKKLFSGLQVELMQADMESLTQTQKAVKNAGYVYHCIGLPYQKWLKLFPKIQKNIIQAVAETDAVLVYSDNLYSYGRMINQALTEDHPENATSKKGKLRKFLAAELLEQHAAGRLKVVIARFGDFLVQMW